jgi:TP901 family phage tail tape measure protein
MTEGQAKVNLILELKERFKTSFQKAKETVNSNVSDIKRKLSSLKNTHVEAFKGMKDELPGFGRAVGLIANPYAMVTAGVIALGVAGFKAAKWSEEWESNMAKVNVTAQLAPAKLNKLSEKLVEIGTRNVAPLEEVPQAFNRIISAGLDVNTSLKVLEPTLRAAKAGFTDIETVAAAGVGVMASSGEDINKVYDVLFATLNKGNAEFKDVAQYLPKIIPLARGAGFALGETAGAWAYLTAQGQSAEQATTGVMNLVKALSDIKTVKGLKSIGVNVFDDKGKMRPMIDTIGQIKKSMNGLTDQQKMVKLDKAHIIDMESKGAIMSMIQDMGKLKEITDFTNNSQGQLNEAYKNSLTGMDSWKIVMNEFKGNVVKPVGDALLGVFAKVGQWVLNTIAAFKDLYNNSMLFRDILSGIGWIVSTVLIKPFVALYNAISAAMNLFKSGDMGKGIENLYRNVKSIFTWLMEIIGQVTSILFKFVTMDFKGAWQGIKQFKMPDLAEIRKRQADEFELNKKPEEDPFAADTTKKAAVDNGPAAKPVGDASIDGITGAAKQVRNITVSIDSFVKGMSISNQNTESMDEKQMEAYFTDMFLRVIRNLELSY